MGGLKVKKLLQRFEKDAEEEGSWLCEGRLPIGLTILTGIAGSTCQKKTLEQAAMGLYAEYSERGEIAGQPCDDGGVVYVQLGGDSRKCSRMLGACFDGEPGEGAGFSTWDGKLGSELTSRLSTTMDEDDGCRLVFIDGADVGVEGRQRLTAALSGLAAAAKEKGVAVVLLMPLTSRNWLCVKDPETGIAATADAVWEIFGDGAGATKCFCTSGGKMTTFSLDAALSRAGRRAARRKTRAGKNGGQEGAAAVLEAGSDPDAGVAPGWEAADAA